MISRPPLPEWKPWVGKRWSQKPRSLKLVGLPFLLILPAIASLSIRVRASNPEKRNVLVQVGSLPRRRAHSCPGRYFVEQSKVDFVSWRCRFLLLPHYLTGGL